MSVHRPDRDAPLAMPVQDFARPFRDPAAPPLPPSGAGPWRLAVFAPTAAATLALALAFADWFRPGGMGWVEPVMIALVCLSFFWIALSVSTAAAGLAAMARPAPLPAAAPRAMTVALVVPIHRESVTDVFGNAAAMLGDLARQDLARPGGRHDFTLWILSDTRDPAIAAAEARGLAALRRRVPAARIRYRRRAANIDRKAGNIGDWLRSHGGGHAAMLVLDADSLMSGAAIVALTDALAADPAAGLVQTVPQIHAARSLFGRMQAFAGAVYGPVLAAGLARWAGDAGNYWGHNAIMRTGAFAAACGLPHLPGGRLILSHDFVEAALLRRAGWAVRMRPDISGSLEEAPQTLVDFVLRDRRWCQGNLQHLALIGAAGLHPVSRFHLVQGALSYLMSPVWCALLLFWAVLGNGEASVIRYFDPAAPMFPLWPVQSVVDGWAVMLFMYAMLLMPKAMGLVALALRGGAVPRHFAAAMAVELAMAVAVAPVLMLQQVVAVLRSALGYREGWRPQRRGCTGYGLRVMVRFHAFETAVGGALAVGIAAGAVSPWLIPIAASLAAALPLSALCGLDLSARRGLAGLLASPDDASPIARRAMAERRAIAAMLDASDAPAAAAPIAAR